MTAIQYNYTTPKAGYQVFHPDNPSEKFDFDQTMGGGVNTINYSYENSRLELPTFGAKPVVYYAGYTDYMQFDLNTVLTSEYDEDNNLIERAVEKYQRLRKLIQLREPLVVLNSAGEQFLCDVDFVQRNKPSLYVDRDFDFIEVTIACTEIGEV